MSAVDRELRANIIGLLRDTKFARVKMGEPQLLQISEQLGVLPDTLRAARKAYRVLSDEMGLDVSEKNRGSYLNVETSAELREIWIHHAKMRHVRHTTLLRSVVHAYLQSSYEPEMLTPPDDLYFSRLNITVPSKRRIQIRATTTWAARNAFIGRSRAMQTTPASILLSLMKETIEGIFARPGTISHIKLSQMFTDVSKYYVPEHVRG